MNKLHLGNNLEILKTFDDESVDLVYIDPPYFTQREWKNTDGVGFSDIFESMESYTDFMSEVLTELKRVLKKTGSLYIHVDKNCAEELSVFCIKKIFSKTQIQPPIHWKRKNSIMKSNNFYDVVDTIFFIKMSLDSIFNKQYKPYANSSVKQGKDVNSESLRRSTLSTSKDSKLFYTYKGYEPPKNGWCLPIEKMQQLDEDGLLVFGKTIRKLIPMNPLGVPLSNLWNDMTSPSSEKRDYPTQKPIKLLERIISASSNEGDVVLDCFMGSGVTCVAAKELGRNYIGIDINPDSVKTAEQRLNETPDTLL